MNDKRTLTTGEIANYCGVNFRTVIRWIQRGQLRAYQLPGRGDNRVEVHNFIAFLRENKDMANSIEAEVLAKNGIERKSDEKSPAAEKVEAIAKPEPKKKSRSRIRN